MIFILILIFGLTAAEEKYADRSNKFAASFYQTISKCISGNFVTSPFLVETAFAALYLASSGETAKQIKNVFQLPDNIEEIEENYQTLLSIFKNQGYNLHIANKLYVDKKYNLDKDWQREVKKIFQIDSTNSNFKDKNGTSAKINHWIQEQTNHQISKIISPCDLREDMVLMIFGALYFQANWSLQFSTADTRKELFYKTETESVLTDLMHIKSRDFNFGESQILDAKFLKLFFEKYEACLVVVLPNKINGLSELEKHLDEILEFQDFDEVPVDVSLPKFRIESDLHVQEYLKDMGIKEVFQENAQISRISETRVFLDKITQKSVFDVNERGVEASSGQKLFIGIPRAMSFPKKFDVNHPFIFYVKIRNLVTFIGRVTSPEK